MSNSIAARSKISRIAGVVALACALTGLAPVAFAEDDVVVNQVTVKFEGLNLRSEAGAQRLLERFNTAAIAVCGGRPAMGPIGQVSNAKRRFRACRATAMENAVSTLDHPTVTALYRGGQATGGRMAQR